MASESALDHYEKGETVILDGDVHKLFTELPENVVMINVKPGSKMRNIIGFSLRAIKEEQNRQFIVSGSGAGIYKAISCTEVVKQKIKGLFQITRISYLKLEEFWEPKNPELDRLKVTREIPQIHMLLSKDPLNPDELGYQPPGNYNLMLSGKSLQQKRKSRQPRVHEQCNQKIKSEDSESNK